MTLEDRSEKYKNVIPGRFQSAAPRYEIDGATKRRLRSLRLRYMTFFTFAFFTLMVQAIHTWSFALLIMFAAFSVAIYTVVKTIILREKI